MDIIARLGRVGVILIGLLAIAAVAFVTFPVLGYDRTTVALFALGLALGAGFVIIVSAKIPPDRGNWRH